MAEQTFQVTWTKKIKVDTSEIWEWDDMDDEQRDEVLAEIAYDRMELEGPDTEDVVGVD